MIDFLAQVASFMVIFALLMAAGMVIFELVDATLGWIIHTADQLLNLDPDDTCLCGGWDDED